MILISHRGNLNGCSPLENHPGQIAQLINSGIHVEVDVWSVNSVFYLGHDNPKFKIEKSFLNNIFLWCHAKNPEALQRMIDSGIHCFWHRNDAYTITSRGFIWCHSESKPIESENSIVYCEKELPGLKVTGVYSDYIDLL